MCSRRSAGRLRAGPWNLKPTVDPRSTLEHCRRRPWQRPAGGLQATWLPSQAVHWGDSGHPSRSRPHSGRRSRVRSSRCQADRATPRRRNHPIRCHGHLRARCHRHQHVRVAARRYCPPLQGQSQGHLGQSNRPLVGVRNHRWVDPGRAADIEWARGIVAGVRRAGSAHSRDRNSASRWQPDGKCRSSRQRCRTR